MKTVRLHGTGDLRIHEGPDPVIGDGEKLIRVKIVGVCGSALYWFSQGETRDAKLEYPLVLGHEFASETEVGQCVALDPATSCGRSESCEQGHPHSPGNMFEITTQSHGRET